MSKVVAAALLVLLSAIVAAWILRFIPKYPSVELQYLSFRELEEICLEANQLKQLKLPKEAYVEVTPATLRIGGVELKVTRVKLVWLVKFGNYTQVYNGSPWTIWCNGTHGGLISWVAIRDTGSLLEIKYFMSNATKTIFLSYCEKGVVKEFVLRNATVFFNGIEVYRFEGWRRIVIKAVEVKS